MKVLLIIDVAKHTDNTSTWVNVGMTVGLYGAGFVVRVVGAPWVIGGGFSIWERD